MSNHTSSHHHHRHKKRINIPKNTIIITLAALVLIGLFALLVRYFDQDEAEQPQPLDETAVTATESEASALQKTTTEAEAIIPETQSSKETPGNKNEAAMNWCALGDSITYGYYSSQEQDGSISVSIDNREHIAWPYLVAKEKNWNLTNLAIGGEGYLIPANDESGISGYIQARSTDFTPYNLITISLGINDWISDIPMGTMDDDPAAETITAFIPAMRATIEAIAESNPMCKIIVILPLNTNGPFHSLGTKETNWAANHEMTSTGTLKQFSETMIEICEMYGIQYINLTTQSCINSISLPAMLPDGVHPAAETHKLLAGELAEKITFK